MSKRKIIIIAAVVVPLLVLASSFFYVRQQYVVPILMYHSVSPDAGPKTALAVTPRTFERQMHFLRKNKYNVIPLEHLVDLISQKKRIPRRTVAITFDDGYQDVYRYAFPILKVYNLPATLFIIVDEVGRAQGDRLSWQEILYMRDSGVVSFGSHALGPAPLINIGSDAQLRQQIFDSKTKLARALDVPVTLFSYPEGMFTPPIRQLVIDAGYRAAVATNPGVSSAADDRFALKRIRISENAANLFVFQMEASGYYTFMKEWKKKRRAHGKI